MSGPTVTSTGQIVWSVRQMLDSKARRTAIKVMKQMPNDVFDNTRGTEGSSPVEYTRSEARFGKRYRLTSEIDPVQSNPLHPTIAAVVDMLPHPELIWDKAAQDRWIEAMRSVLRLVYHEGAK